MQKMTWNEFQDSGLLWWTNRILHTFGIAIVFEQEKGGAISTVYPARVKCRGFDLDTEGDGFEKVADYLQANAASLREEIR